LSQEKRISLYASAVCAIAIGVAFAAYQANSSREPLQAMLETPKGVATPDQMPSPSNLQPKERIPIVIAAARDVRRRLEFPGVVKAIPTRAVDILSPVIGRISEVQIQLGDRVSDKQEIATVIVRDDSADQQSPQTQNQNRPGRISLQSPIAGSIIDVQTKPGDTVKRGSNVATVADLKSIWVTLDLSRRDVSLIAGKTAEIAFAAYPGAVFRGELQFDNTFKENVESAIGRIELDNPEISLKLNMSAVVTLLGPRVLAIVVPKAALVYEDEAANVFVEVAPCTFELRPVEVDFQQGENAMITKGLVTGDRVLAVSVASRDGRRFRTTC
jgi:multidrug efflux pump subunit AcrA (membrane-fusion protein)